MSSSKDVDPPHRSNKNPNDPYTTLGVSKDASLDEIRAAYKKAALLHHPDKQQFNYVKRNDIDRINAHETFTKINSAYEILSDPVLRRRYDQQQQQSPSANILRRYTTRSSRNPIHDAMGMPSFNNNDDDLQQNNPFHFFDKLFRQEFGSDLFGPNPFSRPPFTSKGNNTDKSIDDDLLPPSVGDIFGNSNNRNSFFGDIFRNHDEMMKRMTEEIEKQQQQQQHPFTRGNNNQNQQQRSFYSSTSSSSSTVRNANGEIITTIEKMVSQNNGLPPQKVKEVIVRNKDGSIKERHVTGDESLLINQELQQPPPQLPFAANARTIVPSVATSTTTSSSNNNGHSWWLPSWMTKSSSARDPHEKQ